MEFLNRSRSTLDAPQCRGAQVARAARAAEGTSVILTDAKLHSGQPGQRALCVFSCRSTRDKGTINWTSYRDDCDLIFYMFFLLSL